MKNNKILEAYLEMLNNEELYESNGDQKFSYDGTRFVNRPPTEEEKARSKALGDKWKKTATMPIKDYLDTLPMTNYKLNDVLKAQADTEGDKESKKRNKEFLKKNPISNSQNTYKYDN